MPASSKPGQVQGDESSVAIMQRIESLGGQGSWLTRRVLCQGLAPGRVQELVDHGCAEPVSTGAGVGATVLLPGDLFCSDSFGNFLGEVDR